MYNRFLNVSRYSERGDSYHRAVGYALTQILAKTCPHGHRKKRISRGSLHGLMRTL